MTASITDDQIRALRKAARKSGNKPLVGLCDRALGEDVPGPGGRSPESAREIICARYIDEIPGN